MAYPGSNITFNLYDADPPTFPVGLSRSKTTARTDAKDVIRPKSPISIANTVLPPTTGGSSGQTKAPVGSKDTMGSSSGTAGTGPAVSSGGAGAGSTLKKSQSMRVSSRTPAPLAIPSPPVRDDSFSSSRAGYASGSASAHPGSSNRSVSGPLSASATSSGSQSASGILGSSNPFNDLSSSLQIPSFRPNLSRMGRKISEFGKEVFSLEEEPDVPSRARTPGVGVGGAAAAALGGEKRVQGSQGQGGSAGGNSLKVQAPPLLRSGTAPASSSIPTTAKTSSGAAGAAPAASFLAPMAGMTNAPALSATSALPSPAIRTLSSAAMTTSASQPLPGTATAPRNSINQHNHTHARPAPIPEDVPGMGDEPIMCPFCDKPLPPPLIISQLAHLHAAKERGKRVSEATLVEKTVQADKQSRGSADSIITKPMQQQAVNEGSEKEKEGKEGEKGEKVKAESFLPVVKQSEEAEKAANAPGGVITEQDIAEWSRRAGLAAMLPAGDVSETTASLKAGQAPLRSAAPDTATSASKPTSTTTSAPPKAFPLLPPPPPPAARVKSPSAPSTAVTESTPSVDARKADSRRGSRFGGLFGDKGKDGNAGVDGEEDESDDEYAQGGYAKLSGPASPERVENRELELEERRRSPVGADNNETETKGEDVVNKEKSNESGNGEIGEAANKATGQSSEKVESASSADGKVGDKAEDQDEVKKVLQEVLTKLNTKSHNDLASSHNTLLTSLKIARSNLVMAEANAEMLEEQLRKAQLHHPVVTRASVASTASRPTVDAGRRSLEDGRKASNPTAAPSTAGKPRPNSLIIPASALFETGPMTGPASSQAGSKAANNQNAGGVFGGFFGGKSLHIPTAKELQASAARLGDTLAGPSRPGTPISGALTVAGSGGVSGMGYAHAHGASQLLRGETPTVSHAAGGQSGNTGSAAMRETGSSPAQFFDYHMPSPPMSHLPSPNPDHKGGSGHGSGHGASPSGQPATLARPALSPAHSGQFATEFAKLRNAYASSQSKMEAMAKELTDLKKGKIEMEAELETLSQALFEEANKMVADERRKRLESEEQLKEVREEKEVLKETIKVLGGKDKAIPEVTVSGDVDGDDAGKGKQKDKVKEKTKDHKEEEVDIDDEAWKPRDLDKHYEALRKTIHHVADGASPGTAVLGGDASMLADAVNYTGARREFEAALDEVQAAAEAEGVLGFTPLAVNPVLELSPVLPKHDTASGAEINPWAEVDFSGGGADQTPRRESQHGYGIDPLEGRRESLGLNLVGVDFGEGLDGSSSVRSSLSRQGRVEQGESVQDVDGDKQAREKAKGQGQEEDVRRGSVKMRRTSSA